MPRLTTNLVPLLLAAALGADAKLYKGEKKQNHTCAITNDASVLSCSALSNPSLVDSCCTETFGGLFLATQFWDTYTGLESSNQLLPMDSWSLHGLWPDFCNGSYTQYCDLSRQYDPYPSPKVTNFPAPNTTVPPYTGPPITDFITAFGRYDLLDYMNTYWINQGRPNWVFWAHEFSKHATCYSTFDLPCYGPRYVKHEDMISFFETAISYYRVHPTYDWLADAGITPSNTTNYTLSDIQDALTGASGALPYLGCTGPRYNSTPAGAGSLDNGYTVLDEVWYYMHIYGRPQDMRGSVPVTAGSYNTSCAHAAGAVRYLERTPGSERDPTGQVGYLDFGVADGLKK